MKEKIFAAVMGLALSSSAMSQNAALALPDFKPLESRARDCVNITLGPWLIHSVELFLDGEDPEDAAAKKLLSGIKSIQVRSFEFDGDSAYSRGDIDAVRRQLQAPGWTSLMTVHDRDKDEDVDMYLSIENGQTRGFALIASNPREFTIINVTGALDVSDLPKIQKRLHIGKLIAGRDTLESVAAAQLQGGGGQ